MFCLWDSGIASLASFSFHVTWTRQVNHGRPCHLWAVFYRRKRTLCQDHLWALTLFCNLPKFSQTWAHSCVNCSSIPQLEKKYSQLELGCAPCHLYYFLLLWCMAGEETIHMIMNILYHLYIKSIIHICCRERSKYAQHWPWNDTLLYPSLSMINSCHEVLAQMKSQFQVSRSSHVFILPSFWETSDANRHMEQGKEPKTSLGKLIHPWRFCCQMQPSPRQKREQSSRQKFDEICCSGSFGSFMFQIVCNSIGWCGMGTSMRVPMPTHPSESAPRFHPSVTKSNRAEPLYRKVRRKTATGLYLGHDGHGWPWASGDSRNHGKPLRKSPQVSAAMLEDHEWKTVDSVDTTTRPILKYLQSDHLLELQKVNWISTAS